MPARNQLTALDNHSRRAVVLDGHDDVLQRDVAMRDVAVAPDLPPAEEQRGDAAHAAPRVERLPSVERGTAVDPPAGAVVVKPGAPSACAVCHQRARDPDDAGAGGGHELEASARADRSPRARE